jgi:hypothetical protein
MDCQTIAKYIDKHLKADADKMPLDDLQRHCDDCSQCRDKYAAILATVTRNEVVPPLHPPEKVRSTLARGVSPDTFPDISEPVEFKDAPLTFTLNINGREEEVKIVEPDMDLPLPEGSRLVVQEKDARLCDVVFEFNPESSRPYELHFQVMMGVTYAANHLVTFGIAAEEDKDLLSVYRMMIVDRGGVKADIEMTRGKARLFIVYKPYHE